MIACSNLRDYATERQIATRAAREAPKQYTQRLRLERVAARLAATSEPVLGIALSAGFANHETFTRAFRRRFGCSPSQYRTFALPNASEAERARDVAVTDATGPCIGLFLRSFDQQDQGQRPGGPPWEVYVTDPGDYPDPKDWRTEVYWRMAGHSE
jgi:hypothetical protein